MVERGQGMSLEDAGGSDWQEEGEGKRKEQGQRDVERKPQGGG